MTDTAAQLNLQLLRHTLGPIAPYLADPRVTDIHIYGAAAVWVKRQGEAIRRVDAAWQSDTDLLIAAEAMAEHIGRRLDADHPILDSRLPDGARVNVIIPPCYTSGGACVSIRLFPSERFGAADLRHGGTLDDTGLAILRAVIRLGRNVLISGATGSGKTTLLNVLCSFIPASELVVTVEDSREIAIANPLWAALESKHALHVGDRPVTLQDLVRNALRMNPRWLIVGETRGPEALDLIRAFNTGHSGLSTIHANSAYDALLALENLVLQAGLDIPARAVKEMVARAVSVVIHISQFPDESRRVTEIVEVRGLDYAASPTFPPYHVVPLYRFTPMGHDQGRCVGRFEALHIPEFLNEAVRSPDLDLPLHWKGESS